MALAASYAAGPISGGLLNPAITIGADLAGAGRGFGSSLVYAAVQLAGGVLAALLFKLVPARQEVRKGAVEVRPADFGQETTKTRLWSESIGTFSLAQSL